MCLVAALVGLFFGSISGYVSAWINHHNESTFGASEHQYQYQIWTIPSTPGDYIVWRAVGGHDWLLDEGWNYRMSITLWNGVFWLVVFVVIGALRSWYLQRRNGKQIAK